MKASIITVYEKAAAKKERERIIKIVRDYYGEADAEELERLTEKENE
jgi:hypothetical protein